MVVVVRTELNHLLIYKKWPVRLKTGEWSKAGRIERFCERALAEMGWALAPNVPTEVHLIHKETR